MVNYFLILWAALVLALAGCATTRTTPGADVTGTLPLPPVEFTR